MRWLTIHAGKLIAMDNEITDIELKFLDNALADDTDSCCELTFIKNEFQKFDNVPVRYISDETEMFDRMLKDIEDDNGFTAPCNTKKQAERIHMQLQGGQGTAMATDNPVWKECFKAPLKERSKEHLKECSKERSKERFKLYTSDQGKTPADVDTEWSKNWVVYSPTITTGIDFQPEEPQNVYLFLKGEDTVSPASVLQMITRNRRIKEVFIHATQMKNCLLYTSPSPRDLSTSRMPSSA